MVIVSTLIIRWKLGRSISYSVGEGRYIGQALVGDFLALGGTGRTVTKTLDLRLYLSHLVLEETIKVVGGSSLRRHKFSRKVKRKLMKKNEVMLLKPRSRQSQTKYLSFPGMSWLPGGSRHVSEPATRTTPKSIGNGEGLSL